MASLSKDGSGWRVLFVCPSTQKRMTVRTGKCAKKNAETARNMVEHLVEAKRLGTALDGQAVGWLEKLDGKLRGRLVKVGLVEATEATLLKPFLDEYFDQRQRRGDVADSTLTVWGNVRRNLVDYFGAEKNIRTITTKDADDLAAWLKTDQNLAENTVRRRSQLCRMFFGVAVKRKLLPDNPFVDLAGTVRPNPEKQFFVPRETVDALLDQCPGLELRLLLIFVRYMGVRVPSEIVPLRWADVDWAGQRVVITSPKTKRHRGGDKRVCPIFPEVLPFLQAAWEAAPEGAVWIFPSIRSGEKNLRTWLERAILKAGLTPWPKLWQNFRASRATELVDTYPSHVAAAWLGHTEQIADANYRQVTAAHHERATTEATGPIPGPAQKPAQHTHVSDGKERDEQDADPQNTATYEAIPYSTNTPAGRTVTRTEPIIVGPIVVVWLVLAISINAGCGGCHKPAPRPGSSSHAGGRPSQGAHQDQLYEIAINTLNRLEEFEGMEMLQQSVNRLDRWVAQQPPPDDWSPDPFIVRLREDLSSYTAEVRESASELTKLAEIDDPAAAISQLEKLSGHFNELSRHANDLAETTHILRFSQLAGAMNDQAEQLKALGSSPDGNAMEQVKAYIGQDMSGFERLALRLDEFARQIDVEDLAFPLSANSDLREAVWFRNVARWVTGDDQGDPLGSAIRLFDWTVRNIQLENDPANPDGARPEAILQHAWETLLFGHGMSHDRAWTFMLLTRQQRIDAVLLGTIDPEDPDRRRLKPLGIGVLVDGEVYVFDPELGIPIPGPDGIRLDDGGLTIHPATISQLSADDSLLRQMDLDSEHPYDLRSSDFQKVIVLMEASPSYLTKRMKLVESRLSGDERLVLTTAPEEQAASFKSSAQVVEVRRWDVPYTTILQTIELGPERLRWQSSQLLPFFPGPNVTSPLWKGRMYHFKGVFSGDPNAIMLYQAARRSRRELDAVRHQLDQLSQLEGADANGSRMGAEAVRLLQSVKMNAGYWMGLIHAHQGNNDSAIDYFRKRTIMAFPGGPWTHGAIYNLARALEAKERFPEAIELYRLDETSPGYAGNLLRSVWLEKLTRPEGETAPAEDGSAETKKAEKTP